MPSMSDDRRTLPATMPAYAPPTHALGLRRVVMQQPGIPPQAGASAPAPLEASLFQEIQLQPPERLQLFGHIDSEKAFRERLRQEALERVPPERIVFPEEPNVSKDQYLGRAWPAMHEVVEPNYVCYGRLYYEQVDFERYGWDLDILTPFISAGAFYFDFVTKPYHYGEDPCRCYDCGSGYCLPGDPVPLLLFPPHLSATGALTEAAAIGVVLAVFP